MNNTQTTNQYSLLKQRRFGPFFCTQFCGAFNDNVFKNALIILIAYRAASWSSFGSDTLINMCAALFTLPFFLFSAFAGQLADKYEKSTLIRWIKVLEIIIMLCVVVGFYYQSLYGLMLILFLMGFQSALFGPVKYSILPQHLTEDELTGGNGLVEMGTFVAILIGTIVGGVLVSIKPNGTTYVSIAVISVAILGRLFSQWIPVAKPPAPDLRLNWNIVTQTIRTARYALERKSVFIAIIGISWLWFVGILFLAQVPNYTRHILHGDELVVTLILSVFSIGIGVGSLLCERLSGHKVEIGLVPFGAIGLTIFPLIIAFSGQYFPVHAHLGVADFLRIPMSYWMLANVAAMGAFGGFYVVPLYVMMQLRSVLEHRSRVVAANNITNSFFMVISVLMAMTLLNLGVSIPELFVIVAVLNLILTGTLFIIEPEFIQRFKIWIRRKD